MVARGGVAVFIHIIKNAWNIFTVNFSQLHFYFTEKYSGNYFVKSAVRIPQLISQKNVQGTNCEIQGVSTVCVCIYIYIYGNALNKWTPFWVKIAKNKQGRNRQKCPKTLSKRNGPRQLESLFLCFLGEKMGIGGVLAGISPVLGRFALGWSEIQKERKKEENRGGLGGRDREREIYIYIYLYIYIYRER